jgi:hypothetical protein
MSPGALVGNLLLLEIREIRPFVSSRGAYVACVALAARRGGISYQQSHGSELPCALQYGGQKWVMDRDHGSGVLSPTEAGLLCPGWLSPGRFRHPAQAGFLHPQSLSEWC